MKSFFTALLGVSSLVSVSYAATSCSLQTTVKGKVFPSLIDVTIDDIATGLESGLFTSADLVTTYLARINEVNATLHVVTEVNPDAMAIAAQLDAERANGTVRGPLHGVPILIKNNIATMDKMNNTAGSWALLGAKVPRDSTLATKLRAAGAIILGKTNLSQWANYRSSNSSNGWSAYGGQCYGAYYQSQDPSGSSSGSGVASSIGLAAACLGSETSGSILSPSQRNNLVGIKPTVGLTSRYLVIPISEHQDTVGPMARTVKDAAYVLQTIAGYDPRDNYTSAIPNNHTLPDYVGALDFNSLRGARIGVPRNVLALSTSRVNMPEVMAFNNAINILKGAGATIVDANFTGYEAYLNRTGGGIVLEADFINDLYNYVSQLTYNPNNITDLASLTAFTKSFPLEDYPDRDTATWDAALALGFNNTSPQFWAAYQANLYFGGEGGILGALSRNNLDAAILPTSFSPGIPALVGAPVVTVPMGFYPANTTVVRTSRNLVSVAPGIPFGLSFMGAKFSEATLISFAYAFEQRTKQRNVKQPYITPNIELMDVVGA